jgi:uncharacterized protein YbjQ (UPF0145 family)
MKLKYFMLAVLLAAVPLSQAFAGEVEKHSIAAVFENKSYVEKFGNVKFYFGDQKHPVGKVLGEIKTSGKTNSFNKDGETACQRVLANALIRLSEAAQKRGGNAIVDIHTWFGAQDVSSSNEYICAAGAVIARTEVKGTVMRIP